MVPRISHLFEDGVEKKRCTKCEEYKALEGFGNNKQSWDGLQPTCKECLKQFNRENRENKQQYNKKYWEVKQETQKEKQALWRANNQDHIREYRRLYRKKTR